MTALRTLAVGALAAAAIAGLPAAALTAAPAAVADPTVARCQETPNLGFCDTVYRIHPNRPHGNFAYGPYGDTPPIGG